MKCFFILITFIIVGCTHLPAKRTDKLSILQGVTNTKEVEFSIVAPKAKNFRMELRDESNAIIAPAETHVVSRDFSSYAVFKGVFERDPLKSYNLFVYEGEKLIDQRLVGKGAVNQTRLKLAVVSCMNDFYSQHFKIWESLAQKSPDYLLMIGDNVYTDSSGVNKVQQTNPQVIWERYVDARLTYPVFFQEKLIPTHALWDDHDYGVNDGNSSFKFKEESREIFEAFFAQDLSDEDWVRSYGVGGMLSLGDYNLYFLDGRMYRSEDKNGSHLGLEQTAWFYSKLRQESNPSIVIKGDQFFGGYQPRESFEGSHPLDFEQFVGQLRQIKTPFIFVSGDRHLSEIMQFPRGLFGKPSFEITSSPLHAKTFLDQDDKNPWRVVVQKGKVNFTLLDNEARENHWFINVQTFDENGIELYGRELSVYIKDLQNNLQETRKRRSGERRFRKKKRVKYRR